MDYQNLKLSKMDIKVLGTGCAKCKALEKAVTDAVIQSGVNATVSKVEDIIEIMQFGVMTTPALVIDGKIVVRGRVPSVKDLTLLLTN
jgi:small redox-active disulfide protein 2